ncbi:helix-turn-helix domain-containing protein [Phreatobacter stygius]|uniref:Helix-turn-helix domain-containing protein n=1 Tax=Phreatobacter stygius TaxID=1940610 RepID=A0A4D7B4R7_9HYPH|nr:XRE family transcriptional regulator [Phreatobacter stygius]QCI66013.1 helix-turn-helix domain-containing protein [Phreatobacter stygius]
MTVPDSSPQRPQLGDCLKAARRARGLTLKDVSARTGMALSTLSKVENHQMSLTYDKLLQLSAGLGMEVAELFHPAEMNAPVSAMPTARRSISRKGEGQFVRTKAYGYSYQNTELLGKRMIPIIAELTARSLDEFGPLMRHSGEEYLLVLEGRVAVHTEFYAPELLEPGDGIYIDSTMAHAYLNVGDGPARAICVCSADSPDLYEQLQTLARRSAIPKADDREI